MSQVPPASSRPYTWKTRIRLAHTDAAGRVFFVEPLSLAHLAYEALLDELGFPVGRLLDEGEVGLPIVEATVQIRAQLRVGDDVEFAIFQERIGTTSFTLETRMSRDGRPVGFCRTVHVCVGAQGRPVPLPEGLRDGLRGRLPSSLPARPVAVGQG